MAETTSVRPRVLVAEKLAPSGVDALREHFDVDLGDAWTRAELEERIGDYDGLLIRSATQVDEALLAKATRLSVVGRAGVGVDNVDVPAATKRGIVVANAPQSNVVSAAEHTMALMLAVARNVPRANASMAEGKWERSKLAGVELYEKTLGVLGFGRIGQLVAARAQGFGMRVLAYDPFVSDERVRELGAEKAETPEELYAQADVVTIHLPNSPETKGFLDAAAFAQMKDGVVVLNVARGGLLVLDDLQAAVESGKVGGAGLDVFPSEPMTGHPLFGDPRVVVTPHLGASTAEAQDRAGVQTAEQVVAALTGGSVSTAVNIPAIPAEDMAALEPFVPLATKLGKLAIGLVGGSSVERVEIEYLGRVAERDTRFLTLSVLIGALGGHVDEGVNLVNAGSLAEERGIAVSEARQPSARDFSDLVRVTIASSTDSVRVVGTLVGRRNRPHLLEVWGQRFNLQLDDHLAVFRNRDVPGMIGKVGTLLGERGVNIEQMVVGHTDDDRADQSAVMVLTTDKDLPEEVVQAIVAIDGFVDGHNVALV